jgi:ribosomal-protein-alanine N-acetyltransferase
MSTIRVRAFEAADIAAAEALHLDVFGAEAWDEQGIREVLAMPRAGGLVAAVSDRAEPIGFALYLFVAQDAELLTLAVRRDSRRCGVGRLLVESFMALAMAHGATEALLEVAEDNAAAKRLYARLGFTVAGRRKDYYLRPGKRRVAAHLLRRTLP